MISGCIFVSELWRAVEGQKTQLRTDPSCSCGERRSVMMALTCGVEGKCVYNVLSDMSYASRHAIYSHANLKVPTK